MDRLIFVTAGQRSGISHRTLVIHIYLSVDEGSVLLVNSCVTPLCNGSSASLDRGSSILRPVCASDAVTRREITVRVSMPEDTFVLF